MNSSILFFTKRLGLFLIIATFLNIPNVSAQQNTEIPSALQNTLSEIEEIYLNKNAERRASGYIEGGVHITGWGQAVKGKEAIRQLYEQAFSHLGKTSKVEIKLDDATVISDNATLRGRFVWEGINANGEEFSEEIHMAALFKKIDTKWKIVWDLTGPPVSDESPF